MRPPRPRFSLSAPLPSVEFHLQINGEYRPAEVYIGSKSATPPNTVTESFRLPVTWEGVSIHGEPNAVSLEEELSRCGANTTRAST
ncbi:MAG: hypothetical protein IPK72_22300 [Candidatus Eisenbacteria bacterium]|nr:hypothetical protein [Candidatus Eisenbacteria bacterium]